MRLRVKASLLAILFSVSCVPLSANAAFDVFMKIDGIMGDVTDSAHLGEIALESYTQTFGTDSLDNGRSSSSTKNCSQVVATKFLDSVSPSLISYAVGNVTIPSVVITLRRTGEKPLDFFKATLGVVLIERVDLTDETGELREQVILKPRTIRIEFRRTDRFGNVEGPPIITDMVCT